MVSTKPEPPSPRTVVMFTPRLFARHLPIAGDVTAVNAVTTLGLEGFRTGDYLCGSEGGIEVSGKEGADQRTWVPTRLQGTHFLVPAVRGNPQVKKGTCRWNRWTQSCRTIDLSCCMLANQGLLLGMSAASNSLTPLAAAPRPPAVPP